jgi:hypothetical protein
VREGLPGCISFGGADIDEALAEEVLQVVQPATLEAARLAAEQAHERRDEQVRLLRLELESARYEADRAWRQYNTVEPENRLVAGELEHRWNDALTRVAEIEQRLIGEEERSSTDEPVPPLEDLLELADRLDTVWNDPATDIRLKKRIVRTLVEEVLVDIDEEVGEIDVVIHWRGGIHSALRVPKRGHGQHRATTPPDVLKTIEVLARICDDRLIAGYLNRQHLRTAKGLRWTKERVASLRSRHRIPRHTADRQEENGWMNLDQASSYLGITAKTLRRAVTRGEIHAEHPLSEGPWVFHRGALDSAETAALVERAQARARVNPAGPNPNQLNLDISST